MITIIAFLLTLIGSVNWLMIGLLQYDFVAGIFGYQASILSRIIYIIVGASSLVLVFKLFKGKGTLNILSKRNKKDLASKINKKDKDIDKDKDRNWERDEVFEKDSYAHAYNIESGEDNFRDFDNPDMPRNHTSGLFDEHFDDRGRQ